MSFPILLYQLLKLEMSILLSGRKRGVPQKLLDQTKVCPIGQQMSRKRMAQSMRSYPGIEPGNKSRGLYHALNLLQFFLCAVHLMLADYIAHIYVYYS